MNLRDLEYVVAVSNLKSFSKAAEQCHVSQPTLSTQLRKLEEHLGVVLFERNNRRVQTTDAGLEVVKIARRMLRDGEEIKKVANSSQDPFSGTVRLSAIPTLSSYLFPQLVVKVRDELPNARLILSEEKTEILVNKLISGQIDFGLVALPIVNPALESKELFEDPFLLGVPRDHALAIKDSIDYRSLHDSRLLLLEDGHCLGDQALALCSANGMGVDNDLRATSLETLKQMVIAGTGITLVPQIAAHDHPGIKYLSFSAKERPGRKIGICWRKTMPRVVLLDKLWSIIGTLN